MMAPMKGEESETQRSARARHARATRRSTQGVSQDELQEAKKLLQADPARPAATSEAKPVEEPKAPERAVRDRNGTDILDSKPREAMEEPTGLDLTSSGVSWLIPLIDYHQTASYTLQTD